MVKRELHNFGLLACLLFGMLIFNVIRLNYISVAVDNGDITDKSTAYYTLFYLLASAIDVAGALIIGSSPGYWIKKASVNICKLLILSGFLHLFGFILRSIEGFQPIYLEISFLILILEFIFLGRGGYGVIRRHYQYSNIVTSGSNPRNSNRPVTSGSKNSGR